MVSVLMSAILSLNAYDRGSFYGLDLRSNTAIGQFTAATDHADDAISFNASVFQEGASTVIAYRGTNSAWDVTNGWLLGGGALTAQTEAAALLYREVTGQTSGQIAASSNVTLVGHSLGGGLAGFVSSVYGSPSITFNTMGYVVGAQTLFANLNSFPPTNLFTYFNGVAPTHGIYASPVGSDNFQTTGEVLEATYGVHEPKYLPSN